MDLPRAAIDENVCVIKNSSEPFVYFSLILASFFLFNPLFIRVKRNL